MSKSKRPTIAFTTEVQLGLLEEQASFHVQWHEPLKGKSWAEFIQRVFLLEVARNKRVTLKEIIGTWPDFCWQNRGTSTLGKWLATTRADYERLPAQTKTYLRSLARWHFEVEPSAFGERYEE
jgi:hypothetical protein